jgi:hypothetical protein
MGGKQQADQQGCCAPDSDVERRLNQKYGTADGAYLQNLKAMGISPAKDDPDIPNPTPTTASKTGPSDPSQKVKGPINPKSDNIFQDVSRQYNAIQQRGEFINK